MLLMSDCHNVRLPSRHVSRISAVSSWLVKDVHRYVPTVYVCFQLCCFAIKTHGLHRMALARLSSQNLSSFCVCVCFVPHSMIKDASDTGPKTGHTLRFLSWGCPTVFGCTGSRSSPGNHYTPRQEKRQLRREQGLVPCTQEARRTLLKSARLMWPQYGV